MGSLDFQRSLVTTLPDFPELHPGESSSAMANVTDNSSLPVTEGVCELGLVTMPLLEYVGNMVAFLVQIAIATSTNTVIILVILTNTKLRSLSNLFYVSLATADLAIGSIIMPLTLFDILHGCWPLGAFLCDLRMAVDFTMTSSSFFSLCAIAGDRFGAISDPLKHMRRQSKARTRLMIFAVWLLSALAWVPGIFIISTINPTSHNVCNFILPPVAVLLYCILVYYVPILVMVTFYTLLYLKLRVMLRGVVQVGDQGSIKSTTSTQDFSTISQEELDTDGFSADTKSDNFDSTVSTISKNYGDGLEQQRRRQERRKRVRIEQRAARTLGVVMAAFLCCWGWWVIIWPIEAFHPGSIPKPLYDFTFWAAYLNSTINPFIFMSSNREVRAAAVRLFRNISHKLGRSVGSIKANGA